MDMLRCKISGSAGPGLHALLVLYASLQIHLATASTAPTDPAVGDFRLVQIDTTGGEEPYPRWTVEGVATILTGGEGPRSYNFDCFKDGSSHLMWIREDGAVDNAPVSGRARFLIEAHAATTSLGLYRCVDTDDNSSVSLNITDENPAFHPTQSVVEAFVGDQVILTVHVSTSDGHLNRLKWIDPNGDTPIQMFDPSSDGFAANTSRLCLSSVTLGESGSYNITASRRSAGVDYTNYSIIDLDVFVPSNITIPPLASIAVDEREDLQLVCVATGSSSLTHHLTVTWVRIGENDALPVTSDVMNAENDAGEGAVTITSTLTLSAIRYADSGTYRCQAQVSLTETSSTNIADTVVSVTPILAIDHSGLSGNVLHASPGTSLTIDCYGSGNLNWNTTGVFTISSDGTQPIFTLRDTSRNILQLIIPDFTGGADMTAIYTCYSDLLPRLTQSIFITSGANVAVFISKSNIYAKQGDTVQIIASIRTLSDISSILWYRDGTPLDLESNENYIITQSDNGMINLTILALTEEYAGEYMVEVNIASSTDPANIATATVSVRFPEPTTASVTPSQLTVLVGETVEVSCVAGGEPLDIVWLLGDGSTLPDGVVGEGAKLTIATTTLDHSNRYTCNVSNLLYTSQATFDLIVVDPLVVEIVYESIVSTSHVLLFHHGDANPPSFTCTHQGSQDTSVTWQVMGGAALPGGTAVEDGDTLTWTHRLEYTDSGVYECRAVDPVTGRFGMATIDITVIHEPVLDTIFPAPGVTTGNTAIDFLIPVEFTGTVLTCSAFAWPPPVVEWYRNSGALPQGITARTRTDGGIVTSELVFSTQFTATSVGMYKCEVHSSVPEEETVVSQLVELHQGGTDTPQDNNCPTVSDKSVLYQLRVSTTNCDTWSTTMHSEIAEDFQNLLTRVVSTQCGTECNVSKTTLRIITQKCSDLIDGGVVFRGPVNASSASQTEKIFCALSQWQSAGSLVTIDGNRFSVDSQCSLKIDSYDADECAEEPTETSVDINMILMIAVPVGGVGFLLLVVTLVVVCSLCYCRCCKEEKVSDGYGETGPPPANLLSFTHTPSDSRPPPHLSASRHSVGSMDRQQDNPFYDERDQSSDRYQPPHLQSPVYDVAISPDRQPLFAPHSLPPNSTPGKERETTFTDSGVSLNLTSGAPPGSISPPHEPRRANLQTSAQPYQIPTASTGSINKMGAVNPMWGLQENSSHRGRRHSEGPPNRHSEGPPNRHSEGPPNRTPTSCFGQRGNCFEATDSTEDYSRLNYPMSPAGGSSGAAPERRWYIGSEEPYASLQQSGRSHTIPPYASVHSSQITSPVKMTFPPHLPTREQTKDTTPTPSLDWMKETTPSLDWMKETTPSTDHDSTSEYRKASVSPSIPAIQPCGILV